MSSFCSLDSSFHHSSSISVRGHSRTLVVETAPAATWPAASARSHSSPLRSPALPSRFSSKIFPSPWQFSKPLPVLLSAEQVKDLVQMLELLCFRVKVPELSDASPVFFFFSPLPPSWTEDYVSYGREGLKKHPSMSWNEQKEVRTVGSVVSFQEICRNMKGKSSFVLGHWRASRGQK